MKFFYFFVLTFIFNPSLYAFTECQEIISAQDDFTDILKVVQTNNQYNSDPILLNIEFLRKNHVPKKNSYSSYDFKDLSLDAGVLGIVGLSKSHLPDDKFKHVLAGALITYGATEIAKIYFKNSDRAKLKAILTGVAVTALVGIGKELRDKQGHGTPDANDALYTSLGGALVSIRYQIKF
jgi:hypothetical protein